MKNIKHAMTFLIVMLLCFGIIAGSSVFAEENAVSTQDEKATVTLIADKTAVSPGDVITLTLKVDNTSKFATAKFFIGYNTDQLEYVQDSENSPINGVCGNVQAKKEFSFAFAAAKPQSIKDGVLMTIQYKVKDGVKGNIKFTEDTGILRTYEGTSTVYTEVPHSFVDETAVVSSLNTDISGLTALLQTAKKYKEADYTADSYAALADKITAAEGIDSNNTAEEVSDAKAALHSAIDGLKKAVDKSALQAAVNAVPAGFETTYTPQTAKGVTDALSTANALLNNKNLEDTQENQKAIADAATAVNNAVKALVAIPNKDTLKTKLDAANAMIGDTTVTYMDADKVALQGKIDAAQTVSQDVNASESDVSGAISGLDTAMAAMRKAADKAGFEQAVADYQTKYQQSDYTPASWKDMQTALDAAAAMSKKLDAGQVPATEADAVLAQLEKAANGLVKAPTAQEKENLKNALTLLNEPDYTPETWTVYKSAFDAADTVYKDIDNRSQAEVNGALSTLNQGIAQLITTTEDPDSKVIVHGLKPGQTINVIDQSKDKDTIAAFEKAMAQKSEFTSAKNSKILFLSDITPDGDFTTGKATIYLPVTGDYDAYYVGHKKADDSIQWFGPLTPKDGYVSLEVTGFSDYVLVGVKNAEAVTPGTTSDNAATSATGGSSNANTGISGSNDVNLYAALAFIGGALALTGFELYRAKRKEI